MANDKASGVNGHVDPPLARKEYINMLISDLRSDPLGLSIQVLEDGGESACFVCVCVCVGEGFGWVVPKLEPTNTR
jgi:hypothetical protein